MIEVLEVDDDRCICCGAESCSCDDGTPERVEIEVFRA